MFNPNFGHCFSLENSNNTLENLVLKAQWKYENGMLFSIYSLQWDFVDGTDYMALE